MRVSGNSELAEELKAALRQGKVALGEFMPTYHLIVDVATSPKVMVDSQAGDLERAIVHWIADLLDHHRTGVNVELQRENGIRDDGTCRVFIPPDDKVQRLVMLGIVSGLQRLRDGKGL